MKVLNVTVVYSILQATTGVTYMVTLLAGEQGNDLSYVYGGEISADNHADMIDQCIDIAEKFFNEEEYSIYLNDHLHGNISSKN